MLKKLGFSILLLVLAAIAFPVLLAMMITMFKWYDRYAMFIIHSFNL